MALRACNERWTCRPLRDCGRSRLPPVLRFHLGTTLFYGHCWQCLFFSEHRKVSFPSFAQPQTFVERDGACIVASDVQERRFASCVNSFHDLSHQDAGVAFPKMIGMSANRADFCESWDLQPFARHGNEFPLVENS